MTGFAKLLGLCGALWAVPASAGIDTAPYQAGFDACLQEAVGANDLSACIGRASLSCQDREQDGSSTIGMMFCALMERDLWDARLNAVYQDQIASAVDIDRNEVRYGQAEFAVLEDSLRKAQRAWIGFRDAQCALDYAQWGSGSMRQVAGANCHRNMTAERVIYLLVGWNAQQGD